MNRSEDVKRAMLRNAAIATAGGSHIARDRRRAHLANISRDAGGKLVVKRRDAKQLRDRLALLQMCGIKLPQLRVVLKLSYSGIRMMACGEIEPHPERLQEYHQLLDLWCRKIGAV